MTFFLFFFVTQNHIEIKTLELSESDFSASNKVKMIKCFKEMFKTI